MSTTLAKVLLQERNTQHEERACCWDTGFPDCTGVFALDSSESSQILTRYSQWVLRQSASKNTINLQVVASYGNNA